MGILYLIQYEKLMYFTILQWLLYFLTQCTANNFGIMYSRKRISQKLGPKFYLYISKDIHDILSRTTRSQKEL
jgi:hypothetical protein